MPQLGLLVLIERKNQATLDDKFCIASNFLRSIRKLEVDHLLSLGLRPEVLMDYYKSLNLERADQH